MPRLLITFLFLAASALVAVFYLRPEWRRFQSLGLELEVLEEISTEFDALIADRDKLLEKVNSISKEDLARLDRILPQGPRSSDFLTALETLARESGVLLRRIDLVTPDQEKSRSPAAGTMLQPRPASAASAGQERTQAEELPFSVQVAGSYAAFKKFLASLERNIRLIDVDEISFGAERGDFLEFSLKAKTYYQQ